VAAANRTRLIGRLPSGEVKAAELICNAPGFDFVHLANSLAVRHASLVARLGDGERRFFANRGRQRHGRQPGHVPG
jgi:2-succinyl-5-enolpyruvyl-6-hydroxy-3-cyclohexene-1-carboxylate synthase